MRFGVGRLLAKQATRGLAFTSQSKQALARALGFKVARLAKQLVYKLWFGRARERFSQVATLPTAILLSKT
eukprot:11161176-Lingulodinium_polyedra.AAC.1